MKSSAQPPKVPLWIFFATDLALLAAAAFIAARSSQPLSPTATLSIVACVIAGVIVILIPLVTHIERQKNEQLDERQRELEALARTVGSAAEQISIAAGGLHEIADLAQRNLRQAEQLPHKLQEKIAEFQAQLANASDAEKEELENEIAALRSSETERLETVADKLARATVDLTKLEAATHQQLAATTEAIAKLSLGTAGAIGKAQAAAEQALTQARVEAARQLGEAAGRHARSFDQASHEAIAALDARLASAAPALAERIARELSDRITLPSFNPRGEARPENAGPATVSSPPPATSGAHPVVEATAPDHAVAVELESGNGASNPAAQPVRRSRKARREEAGGPTDDAAQPDATPGVPHVPGLEPAPIAPGKFTEVAPVAPKTAEPFAVATAAVSPRTHADVPSRPHEPPHTSPVERRRVARKAAPSAESAEADLSLDSERSEALDPACGERVLSSDGATRIIVTAYIGIGNRVFIRGEGPGLAWDKGVPLQFVSIGKWRWETNEAGAPIRFKLLKNDEQECAGLGALSLEPGHQQELSASFA
jgi:hypothetical protein